jgi:hypothetical protein
MAVTVLSYGHIPEKGINYTAITDSSADWTDPTLPNNTYFYDKGDKLPHYKDANGNILDVVNKTDVIQGACSDETTAITAGSGKLTFRMPYAMTLTAVRASLTTPQASGSIFTVDIIQNGVSVLSPKLTINNTQRTSTTATTPAVIVVSSLSDDAEIRVDVTQIGDGTAKGLKVTLIGYRS